MKKLQCVVSMCIDQTLETINQKLEYFYKSLSLQMQLKIVFEKDSTEEDKESRRNEVYGWYTRLIDQQRAVIKHVSVPSKNKFLSQLIDFLLTHVEFQLLPRFEATKKFIEIEIIEKNDIEFNQIEA